MTCLDTTFHTRFVPRVHSPGGVERLQAMRAEAIGAA